MYKIFEKKREYKLNAVKVKSIERQKDKNYEFLVDDKLEYRTDFTLTEEERQK